MILQFNAECNPPALARNSTFPCLESSAVLAIPQARAAINALLIVKGWHAIFAARDGLARTHLHAQFRFTVMTNLRVLEYDMIGISGGRLHTSTHQQRVLMRDQKLAIEWNFRPAAPVHDAVVKGCTLRYALLLQLLEFHRRDPLSHEVFERELFCIGSRVLRKCDLSARKARDAMPIRPRPTPYRIRCANRLRP